MLECYLSIIHWQSIQSLVIVQAEWIPVLASSRSLSTRWIVGALEVFSNDVVVKATHCQLGSDPLSGPLVPRTRRSGADSL